MAQDPELPSETEEVLSGPQLVAGQVVRPGKTSMLPVPNIWVTLHRVGSDNAAPLDSIRADREGRYSFDFRRTGDERAIYFVSASYGGVAYFTPPLAHNTVRGEEAEIAVFDTTSAPVPISVRGHHVIVSAVNATGTRRVTEVFELANDSSVTRVIAGDGSEPVWSTPFPPRASAFQVSQGDIPSVAARFVNGKAGIYAPIAPGIKQFAFSYTLPADAFPLSVPIIRDTQILEVLIEAEKGSVTGAKLEEKAPVAIEQRSFRRFLADDVPANSVSLIDLPAEVEVGRIDPRYMIALTLIIGGSMIFALARALRRR